jgi:hypothetical protein
VQSFQSRAISGAVGLRPIRDDPARVSVGFLEKTCANKVMKLCL